MREQTDADVIVQGAYIKALLEIILTPMRQVARDAGYTIAVHGSLTRDIDLVAIPWREHNVDSADYLYQLLVGAIGGAGVKARVHGQEWTLKPHGRCAKQIVVFCGNGDATLDISVMPTIENSK